MVFCIDLAGEMLRYNVEVGPGLNDGIEIDRLRSGERKEKGVAGCRPLGGVGGRVRADRLVQSSVSQRARGRRILLLRPSF